MHSIMRVFIVLVLCMPVFGWSTTRIVQEVLFNRNVEGHLKRAAYASTIELAEKELEVAVSYLKEHRMTSGYTSILWTTPDEDIGFWYTNLVASLEELRKVQGGATQLEKSNILMKLRETLVDQGQMVHVTVPRGISIFPHNVAYFFWAFGSLFVGVVSVIFGLGSAGSGRRY